MKNWGILFIMKNSIKDLTEKLIFINMMTRHMEERIDIFEDILSDQFFIENMNHLYQKILVTLQQRGKLMLCGNGGSAADCQHITGEFVGRLISDREAWPAISLCADISVITCLGNDYSYENIFKRQVEAYGHSEDLLISLSTSGNSKNVCVAIQKCKEMGISTYSITNNIGGKIASISDYMLKIPTMNTQVVQEMTITVFHIICEMLEYNHIIDK
jgi:D-sedoheptulose 7-phosphate isomerase